MVPLYIEDPSNLVEPKHRPLSPDSALASSESSGGKQGKNKTSVSGGKNNRRQNFRENNNDFTKNQQQRQQSGLAGSLIRINPYEQFKPVVKKSARIQEKIALFERKKFVKSSLDQNLNKSLMTSKTNCTFPRPRSQSFTSLMVDLRQDIIRVSSFSRYLNGTFP